MTFATKMTRTSTGLPQLGPEPSASTNSAMVALQIAKKKSIAKEQKLNTAIFYFDRKLIGVNKTFDNIAAFKQDVKSIYTEVNSKF